VINKEDKTSLFPQISTATSNLKISMFIFSVDSSQTSYLLRQDRRYVNDIRSKDAVNQKLMCRADLSNDLSMICTLDFGVANSVLLKA